MAWAFHAPFYKPHASQFISVPGGILRGGCTLLALAACDVVSKGVRAWVGDPHAECPDPGSVANVQAVMGRIYRDAVAVGNCAANGAASQNGMIREAKRISLPVKDVLPFQGRILDYNEWAAFLHKYVAWSDKPYACLMQIANGQALIDAETNQQDEADLQVHAICLYGTQTDPHSPASGGYICADGDNPGANEHPAVYSLNTINNAKPISIICFDYA